MKGQFNLEEIKNKALEQFRSGKSLFDKGEPSHPYLNPELSLEKIPMAVIRKNSMKG